MDLSWFDWFVGVALAQLVVGLLDTGLTVWGRRLGLRESNTVVQRWMDMFNDAWPIPKVSIHVVVAVAIVLLRIDWLTVIVAVLVLGYLVVIRNNWRRISDKRRERSA
tara:strand:- start:1848 stop:2171 length:324 start_codon:yes stop_codon:yes gene_type:complete